MSGTNLDMLAMNRIGSMMQFMEPGSFSSMTFQFVLTLCMIVLVAINDRVRAIVNLVIDRFLALIRSRKPSLSFRATRLLDRPELGLQASDEFRAWIAHIQEKIASDLKLGRDPVITNVVACQTGKKFVPAWRTSDEPAELSRVMKGQSTEWLPQSFQTYEIESNVTAHLTRQPIQSQGNTMIEEYMLEIRATRPDACSYLFKRHEHVVCQFRRNHNLAKSLDPMIFEFTGIKKAEYNLPERMEWNYRPFKSEHDFSKMSFAGKADFLEAHSMFMSSRDSYEQLGDPWTFSALLYGTPGCGKTSLVKALVNHMRTMYNITMHIIVIPLSKIHKTEHFRKAVMSDEICGYNIPYENRIIVFEDFDACGVEELFKRRELSEKTLPEPQPANENITDGPQNITIVNKGPGFPPDHIQNDDKLTLSAILNVLDGMTERTGQHAFWTTNVENPVERFDTAFLRPGRMDCVVKFSPCNIDDIRFFLGLKYPKSNVEKADLSHIPRGEWTPARVKQVMKSSLALKQVILKLEKGVAATEIGAI